uniref:Uncharacterized protein n=1 Tax=Peronospora matthiolae TaxID=2874970 RepID=A0AAV1TLA9_9STRA
MGKIVTLSSSPRPLTCVCDVMRCAPCGRVGKFRLDNAVKDVLRVYRGNIRLPARMTDVILTVSTPIQISSSCSICDTYHVEDNSSVAAAVLKQALQTFVGVDWSLDQ